MSPHADGFRRLERSNPGATAWRLIGRAARSRAHRSPLAARRAPIVLSVKSRGLSEGVSSSHSSGARPGGGARAVGGGQRLAARVLQEVHVDAGRPRRSTDRSIVATAGRRSAITVAMSWQNSRALAYDVPGANGT